MGFGQTRNLPGNSLLFPLEIPVKGKLMLTPEEREKIRQLSSEGWTSSRIAKELGFDPKTVRGVLRKNGEKVRNSSPQKLEATPDLEVDSKVAARVFSRLNAGATPEKIVEEEVIAPDAVFVLHEKWLKMKNRGVLLRFEDRILSALEVLPGLMDRLAVIEDGLQNDPSYNLRELFKCQNCEEHSGVAMKLQCTHCGNDTSRGWFQEDDEEPERDTEPDAEEQVLFGKLIKRG